MPNVQPRYSKEEIARRGDDIYESEIRPRLKKSDQGKFAAIDIESHEFEVAENELAACHQLRARVPGAQIWLVRIGSPFVYRFGRTDVRKPE
jgi:hypothetical protein